MILIRYWDNLDAIRRLGSHIDDTSYLVFLQYLIYLMQNANLKMQS